MAANTLANLVFLQIQSLTKKQILLLKELVSDCLAHDLYLPEMHWHLLKSPSSFAGTFLIIEKNILIGFLRIFFFYQNDVEIVLLIHPKHRRKALASKLLQQAKPLLIAKKILNYRFSVNNKNIGWLENLKGKYDYTDYFLSHNLSSLHVAKHKVEIANDKDYSQLINLERQCFTEVTLTQSRLQALSKDTNFQLLIIKLDLNIVAKLHLKFHFEYAEIFDVAVEPKYQRQGYATSIINYALQISYKKNKLKVILNTESTNKNALQLYLKNGFIIEDEKNYWQLPINYF